MNKQEFIKQSWSEAGFDWEQIKELVNESGILQLKEPESKYSLTGYSTAYDHGLIKGLGFNHKCFMISLDSLEGINDNNGWTKIESESDLPDIHDIRMFMPCERGKPRPDYSINSITIKNGFNAGVITHWRPITQIPNPLY